MAVWCVCVGECMVVEEHYSLSPAFQACPLLFRKAERLHGLSLPLRHWALTCKHVANPPLYPSPQTLFALLRSNPLGKCFYSHPKKASNGWFLVSWSVHLTFLAVVLHCRSLDGSDELVQVSIVLGHQDAWTNKWGFTSVLPPDRHNTIGRAPLPTSSQWCQRWLYWSRKYVCPLSQCSGALRGSVPVSGPQSKNGFCFLHADQTKA